MSESTAGLALNTGHRAWRETVELLSSMRFAIALLTIICIASVIGTVVQQNQPPVNYVNQFGPFWAEVFGSLGLYAVYSAGWFLVILLFLVISTSLCIARNTPKILGDLRSFKEHVRESSLQAFHLKARGTLGGGREAAMARVHDVLSGKGWQARAQVREHGVMVAARQGGANKIGYLAAHSAIVLVCLGGALDGDLVVRAQMWLQDKTPYTGGGMVNEVPQSHWLSPANPTYRGSLPVPEGGRSNVMRLAMGDGLLLQELPFDVELKKFIVEYYETGMPKLFASEVVLHDRETGEKVERTIKVNEPASFKGVTIYQSSFDDGGSRLTLQGRTLGRAGAPFEVQGVVGASSRLTTGDDAQALTLEFSGLRVINVENLAAEGGSATDVRGVDLTQSLDRHLGSAARKPGADKLLRNIGPSVNYKLRDAAGQAREFQNYMLPVELDGQRLFLLGQRETPDQPFRYLRVPADDRGSMDDWFALRAALADAGLRDKAARRFVAMAAPEGKTELAEQLGASARVALALFGGAEALEPGETPRGGLVALQDFLDRKVPPEQRERTGEVMLRIVNGALFELLNLTREQAGLAPLKDGEATRAFMTQSVVSLSDSFAYAAPVVLSLKDFTQVQASVFQVTRAPGKTLVYLGCVLLIIGVFAMLYVRERRLWIWLGDAPATPRPGEPSDAEPSDAGTVHVTMALSSTRTTLDTEREFEALRHALLSPR